MVLRALAFKVWLPALARSARFFAFIAMDAQEVRYERVRSKIIRRGRSPSPPSESLDCRAAQPDLRRLTVLTSSRRDLGPFAAILNPELQLKVDNGCGITTITVPTVSVWLKRVSGFFGGGYRPPQKSAGWALGLRKRLGPPNMPQTPQLPWFSHACGHSRLEAATGRTHNQNHLKTPAP